MQPTQVYETTIFDRESGAGLSFVTVPLHALPYADLPEALEGIAAALKFEPAEPGLIPDETKSGRARLARAIDAMLAYPTEYRGIDRLSPQPGGQLPRSGFARYLA